MQMKILLASCALLLPLPAAAEPIAVTATPLALDQADPPNLRIGPLAFLDGLVLSSGDPRFGGWSDLLIEDGRLTAVGDQGSLLTATLAFDGDGRLTGLKDSDLQPLLDERGQPLTSKEAADAEAMARLPDGSLVVGFERQHRVLRYAAPGAPAEAFLSPPEMQAVGDPNHGLEALATLPDGRLIGLLEGSDEHDATLGLIWRDGGSQSFLYPLEDGFQVTAAAFLPHPEGGSGDLLVLERFYTPATGPKARLYLVPLDSLRPNEPAKAELWGELAPPRAVDNMEGLAVVRDDLGRTLVYLLSDDNFNKGLQRTLLLRFELTYE